MAAHEWEQRVRHIEEWIILADELRQRLADQVGVLTQAQGLDRAQPGAGRGPKTTISAVAATGGITAAAGDTLGQGDATLRHRSGATLTSGDTVTVYSNFSVAIPAGTRLEIAPDGAQYKLVGADCPT